MCCSRISHPGQWTGWAELSQVNPRLVYASGSGYGLSGPDRDNLAMDLTIQAVSGLISTTGFADSPPVKAGLAVVDFLSGIHLYAAVTTRCSSAKAAAFGRYLGQRYRDVPNIIWMYGNDFQTWENPADDAVVLAVAKGIRSVDPNHIHTTELN